MTGPMPKLVTQCPTPVPAHEILCHRHIGNSCLFQPIVSHETVIKGSILLPIVILSCALLHKKLHCIQWDYSRSKVLLSLGRGIKTISIMYLMVCWPVLLLG